MARARARGWWYPWIFVAGMLLVVAVNGVLITLAVDTFPGLDTQDAYRKGLAYNRTLSEARDVEKRGWRADVRFAPRDRTAEAGDLLVSLAGADGLPLRGLAVTAALIRPTQGGVDQHVVLEERGEGLYGAAVTLPLAGQWDAHLWARGGGDTWQTTRRIHVP